jgi:hypothetical protein
MTTDNRTYQREWYRRNAERLRPIRNARRKANADNANAYHRSRRQKNHNTILARESIYREKNRERIKSNATRYRKNNRKKTSQAVYKSRAKRYLSDPKFRMQVQLKAYAHRKIHKGPIGTFLSLFGCTIGELRRHIEKQWLTNMSWGNYGRRGWHIDHIRPCASFDLSDPEQQKQCFHWTNLQPLWADDNIKKSDTWNPTT